MVGITHYSDYPGVYQCFFTTDHQLFASSAALLKVGYWDIFPPSTVLKTNTEQAFACGAAVLGPLSGDVPTVEWTFDSRHFPSLSFENPTVKGRANLKSSASNLDATDFSKTIKCEGSYLDSSGTVELPQKVFAVDLLDISGTNEGVEGYAVVDEAVTVECVVKTTDISLGKSLKLRTGSVKPIGNSFLKEKIAGSNTVSFSDAINVGDSVHLKVYDVIKKTNIELVFLDKNDKKELGITLSKDYIYVNEVLYDPLAMYTIEPAMSIDIFFLPSKEISVSVNGVPIKTIAQPSIYKNLNKFSISNGRMAEFLILEQLSAMPTALKKVKKNGITTFSRVTKINKISKDNVGFYLCDIETSYDEYYFAQATNAFNLNLATFVTTPVKEVEVIAFDGFFFNLDVTVMYFGTPTSPSVSLIRSSDETVVSADYALLTPDLGTKTMKVSYAVPWNLPYERAANYTWQLQYTDILYPGVAEGGTTVYEGYLELETEMILSLVGQKTQVICFGYGITPGPRSGKLLINGEVQSREDWPSTELYDENERYTTFSFIGIAGANETDAYECQAEFQQSHTMKSINQATIFIVTYFFEPSAFDGKVGQQTTLNVQINVPFDDTELQVFWIDKNGIENEEISHEITNNVYTSYYVALMTDTESYTVRIVIGDGNLDGRLQKPLIRECILKYLKVVAVEFQPVFISGTVKATTEPLDIVWFNDSETIVDPNWTIARTSETTFSVRIYFVYEPDVMESTEIAGDYTFQALWKDGDIVNSASATQLTTARLIQNVARYLFAAYDFPLELTIEVTYESDFTIEVTWYEKWSLEYEIDDTFVKTSKGLSTLTTDSITNIYGGVLYYAAVKIIIESTDQEYILWTDYAEVVVQKLALSYKGVQDRMAFVAAGTEVEVLRSFEIIVKILE